MKKAILFFSSGILLIAAFSAIFFIKPSRAANISTTISISICGNNIREGEEECDNADLGGNTCLSRGYGGGTLSCLPACLFNFSACTARVSSGGGGGAVAAPAVTTPAPIETKVTLAGRAYPSSRVIALKDGQLAATTIAGADAKFSISLGGLAVGSHTFSIYSEDQEGKKSSLLNFPLVFTPGAAISVSGIFVSPTIGLDKSEVKRGDVLTIFGQSSPNSQVTIAIASEGSLSEQVQADSSGLYSYSFDTSVLEEGDHLAKARASQQGEVTPFSQSLGFVVGDKTIQKKEDKAATPGDINGDGQVNLIDFSILAYWYNKPTPETRADLNHDGRVNLVDFSILASYWTG